MGMNEARNKAIDVGYKKKTILVCACPSRGQTVCVSPFIFPSLLYGSMQGTLAMKFR